MTREEEEVGEGVISFEWIPFRLGKRWWGTEGGSVMCMYVCVDVCGVD